MSLQEETTKVATHKELETDVLVAGGGMAGVCAAISAARNGAKVILCQDRFVLGGNASSEIRMHICGADKLGNRGSCESVEARESGIIEEIRLENAVRNPQRSWSMGDLILYEKCVAEPNLTLMLDTSITAADVDRRNIKSIYAQRQSTEDTFTIIAKSYIDCTGDGRMAAEAGATCMRGIESVDDFNEAGAPIETDNHEMGMSLLFEARDMGENTPYIAPSWARKFTDSQLALRDCSHFNYGYWWIEWGGDKDTIKDLPQIRHNLLAILLGVWDYIKNSGKFDADNYALDWFGFLPGKRQSRRLNGLYTLTENDLQNPKPFADTIAYGGWPFDTHPPEGIDATDQAPAKQAKAPYLYPIPLRSCISSDVDNLMFAGRNISASYIAFASTRVMATCALMGQAVGTAAAFAIAKNIPVIELSEKVNIEAVQRQLLSDDCYLPGVDMQGNNLACQSVIFASSTKGEFYPENVTTSLTRIVCGKEGVAPQMIAEGTHRWVSAQTVDSQNPQWLELSWQEDVSFSEIRLTFDTGLHRPLALSHDKASEIDDKMVWAAQPETVKDYRILYNSPDGWQELITVENNYQRFRTHKFSSLTTDKLKIEVLSTNGASEAIICKIEIKAGV